MINIKLFCAAGMSTSMLVAKMRESALVQGIEAEIKAYPIAKLDSELPSASVALLGPQVQYLFQNAKKTAASLNIPIGMIPMKDYGRVNGEAVLNYALLLLNQ